MSGRSDPDPVEKILVQEGSKNDSVKCPYYFITGDPPCLRPMFRQLLPSPLIVGLTSGSPRLLTKFRISLVLGCETFDKC